MKVLQFTIPVAHDKSIIIEQVDLPHFYPYLHRHHETQITWIQQGEGILIAGNNMHTFAAGDIFMLGPNLPHLFKSNPEYFESESDKSVRALTLFFNPAGMLAPVFQLPELKSFKIFLQQNQQGFQIPDQLFNEVSAGMLAAQNALGPDQLFHFLQLLKTLHNLPLNSDDLSAYGSTHRISESEGIRISNIYSYIMQHYSEPVTLTEVAREASMTPQAFCRYFKKHTGHTFITFLNEIRINEACKKLTGQHTESISAVAYQCGFNSIPNFNRAFKSLTGRSPREYADHYAGNLR